MRARAARVSSTVVLAAAVAAMLLAGCSASSEGEQLAGPGWSAELAQLAETTENEFVRAVAADGEITRAEMDETFQRLKRCMADRGFDLSIMATDGSSYSYAFAQQGENDGKVLTACQDESGEYPLSTLYVQIWANPDNVDLDEARAQCLRNEGLVGADFTAEQAKQAWQSYGLSGTGATAFDDEKKGARCLDNPLGADRLPEIDKLPGT